MRWVEEDYARDLYRDLVSHFEGDSPTTEVLIEGSGVHWQLTAKRANRSGVVNCFNVRGRPEYLCSFDEGDQTIAMGRTVSKGDVVQSIVDWLDGAALNRLYDGFAFVDRQKRDLLDISKAVNVQVPELEVGATHDLKHVVCDLYELWITQRNRACKIAYWGKNQFADASFLWDQCELFRFSAHDVSQLGRVLKRWLCDHLMPCALRSEFPWIEIGELATYYEQGRPIEGEFFISWNSIEEFYSKATIPPRDKILTLIKEMRQRGYDKILRAGQSLYSLILSRSRRHGLRPEQPMLKFHFHNNAAEIQARFEENNIIPVPKIAFSSEIEGLLKQLAAARVD